MCREVVCAIQGLINQAKTLTISLLQSGILTHGQVAMIRVALLDAARTLEPLAKKPIEPQ